jgi:hypothetical protein
MQAATKRSTHATGDGSTVRNTKVIHNAGTLKL